MNAIASGPPTRTSSTTSVVIHASIDDVWRALTDPTRMAAWMGDPSMNVSVETTWAVGGLIVVRGHHHVDFENRGVVVVVDAPRALAYTMLSSLSRLPDVPANHTTLAFALSSTPTSTPTSTPPSTTLALTLGPFANFGIQRHLEFYWQVTLGVLKRSIEEHRATLATSQHL
jgi:uncharacterized protein YndB with AHSA1/START domain